MANLRYILSGLISGILLVISSALLVSIYRDTYESIGFKIICIIEILHIVIFYFPIHKIKLSKVFLFDFGVFLSIQFLDLLYSFSPLPAIIPRMSDYDNPGDGIGLMIYAGIFLCCMLITRLITILVAVLIEQIKKFRYNNEALK